MQTKNIGYNPYYFDIGQSAPKSTLSGKTLHTYYYKGIWKLGTWADRNLLTRITKENNNGTITNDDFRARVASLYKKIRDSR